MRKILWLSLLLAACKTAEPTPVPAAAPEAETAPAASTEPIHLTVVATNDQHGWVMTQVQKVGAVELLQGGLGALSGYVAILRAENPDGVLLLDAGDIFQGTLASNITEGAVMIDAMNAIGYDAAAIGNHEFDYGPVGPVSVALPPGVDPFGALKARILQAQFPLISANIYQAANGHRPEWLAGDGMKIATKQGVRIGIVGLTTPQTPTTTVPVNVATLRFGSLAPEALTAAKRLRERGAEVVIAVVHAGGLCAKWDDPVDLSSCDTKTGEIFEMMEGLPPGTLDAVVAGHTHHPLGHFVNGTPIIESFGMGKTFGTIDLYLDPKTHQVLAQKTKLTPNQEICLSVDAKSNSCEPHVLGDRTDLEVKPATYHGQKVTPDAKVVAAIEPALAQVAALQKKDLGLSVPKTLLRNYNGEGPLGDLFADTLRAAEKADVAVLNPGGFRADLKAGKLTYGAVFEVIPFDNTVATLNLTGEQLKRVMTAAYGNRKGVFAISGLEVKLGKCVGSDRLKELKLANGKAIEPTKQYRVVMPDFLARGGDGLGPALSTIEPERVDLGESRELNFRDVMVAQWQKSKEGFNAPKAGRISFSAEPAKCPDVPPTAPGSAPTGSPGATAGSTPGSAAPGPSSGR